MSTETDEQRDQAFSTSESEYGYRPISPMAVLSFVLAVLSYLAFADLLFLFIPVLGVAIASLTSRRLEAAKREYAGQVLTKGAIFLMLIAGIGAPTHYLVQRFIIIREAGAISAQYVDLLLQNRIKEAFVLRNSPLARSEAQDAADDLIIRAGDKYRTFIEFSQSADTLGGRLADAQVTDLGCFGYRYSGGTFNVETLYRIVMDSKTYEIQVLAIGATAANEEWDGRQWYVLGDKFTLLEEEDGS